MKTLPRWTMAWSAAIVVAIPAAFIASTALAHHSYAMFDRNVVRVFTGVVSSVEPGADHLQIFFAPMTEQRDGVERDERGEPIIWSLEMTGSAAVAKFGITVAGFPPGTVFSAGLSPARDGGHSGFAYRTRDNQSVLFKCPGRVRPAPGKHCDSVDGVTLHGTATELPAPTQP